MRNSYRVKMDQCVRCVNSACYRYMVGDSMLPVVALE